MTRWNSLPVVLTLLLGAIADPSTRTHAQQQSTAKASVAATMRNVRYHFTDSIVIDVRRINGRLVPQANHELPVFDNANSFLLAIDSAEIVIGADAMTHLMNEYTFAAKDAPVKKLSVSIAGGTVKVKGALHSKGDLPFETEGTIASTENGLLRIHATKIRAAHMPAKGLMDLFGIEITDLVKTNKVRGLTVDKDDLILDPQQLFPPPTIQGKISTVALRGENIVLIFGKSQATCKDSLTGVNNYMAYRGGTLRFGKLTMSDTDLTLIDADQRDPFDFYLTHYLDQLVAGYSKTTPQNGLRVYMPDYNKLRHPVQRRK